MNIRQQTFQTAKGDLAAAIHVPQKKGGLLAILCPGYLDTKDYPHLVGLADALCGLGYIVVRFDPTGTWESGGDISDYHITQYLEDIKTVLDSMEKMETYQQILLAGHSRGGMLSLLYAARDPRITQVVAIMPSSGAETKNREEWQKEGVRISKRDLPGTADGVREFPVPFSHALDRDQYDVVKDVERIHIPTLFLAGELDDVVLPEDVQEIYDNANEPKKYILLKGIGHDYRFNPEEIKIVNELIAKELQKS